MARLKPFFSFYGSKWTLAPHYPEPAYPCIIEPFAGSASYSLCHPARKVQLYDLDDFICGIWDYLIRAPEKEILSLPDLPDARSTADLPIPREAQWLIGMWLNPGSSQPKLRWSSWGKKWKNKDGKLFWGERVRQRIASQQQYIRHWKILLSDYRHIPGSHAAWFIDPPYEDKGKYYRKNSIDYDELSLWCRRRHGQTIVCEQEGAEWLPFRQFRSIAGQRIKSTEMIWTKHPQQLSLGW